MSIPWSWWLLPWKQTTSQWILHWNYSFKPQHSAVTPHLLLLHLFSVLGFSIKSHFLLNQRLSLYTCIPLVCGRSYTWSQTVVSVNRTNHIWNVRTSVQPTNIANISVGYRLVVMVTADYIQTGFKKKICLINSW